MKKLSVVILWLFMIALGSGCESGGVGSGPGAGQTASYDGITPEGLIAGDDRASVVEALRDGLRPVSLASNEIGLDEQGAAVPLTEVVVYLVPDATVAEANEALRAEGGQVLSTLEGIPRILVRIPNPGSVEGLWQVMERLESHPAIEHVRQTHLAAPDLLPPLYEYEDGDWFDAERFAKIRHHLAIRAHAAWNLRPFLERGEGALPPNLVMTDRFGGLAPPLSPDFDVNILQMVPLPQSGDPDPHGYQMLSVIAASFEGVDTERGMITGVYPATPASVLDTILINASVGATQLSWEMTERATLYVVASLGNNVVVNTSMGMVCYTSQSQQVIPCAEESIRTAALDWITDVRGRGLEGRFLHVVAAGNTLLPGDTDARLNSSFAAARLMTDLVDAEGNPVPPLRNTLVIENAVASEDAPYEPVCLNQRSKRGGDLAAIGTDVWSLSGPQEGVAVGSGTSPAAAQVAGVAAYVWAIQPELSVEALRARLEATARRIQGGSAGGPVCDEEAPAPVVDAYLAVLAADDPEAVTGDESPDQARVRVFLLDITGPTGGRDGLFDEHDLEQWAQVLSDWGGEPYEDSRYDLNGDGRVGEGEARFDLDADGFVETEVEWRIEDTQVQFNENELDDWNILCAYAYSNLYVGSADERREILKPHMDRCGVVFPLAMVTKVFHASEDHDDVQYAVVDPETGDIRDLGSPFAFGAAIDLPAAWSPAGPRRFAYPTFSPDPGLAVYDPATDAERRVFAWSIWAWLYQDYIRWTWTSDGQDLILSNHVSMDLGFSDFACAELVGISRDGVEKWRLPYPCNATSSGDTYEVYSETTRALVPRPGEEAVAVFVTAEKTFYGKDFDGEWRSRGSRPADDRWKVVLVEDGVSRRLLGYRDVLRELGLPSETDVYVEQMKWSPDGRYLAIPIRVWDERGDGQSWLFVVDAERTTVFAHANVSGDPNVFCYGCFDWSPDGSELVKVVMRPGYGAPLIYRTRPDDTSGTVLVNPAGTRAGGVRWSPRGDRISWISDQGMHLADAQTGTEITVLAAGEPLWSPTGEYLAVKGGSLLYVVDTEGTEMLSVPAGVTDTVAWSPTGRKLAVALPDSQVIRVYDLESETPGEPVTEISLSAPVSRIRLWW